MSDAPAPFYHNERNELGGHSGLLPNLPAAVKAMALDADSYVAAWDALAKALTPPPQALPYAAMSSLPDPSRAGIIQPPGLAPESIIKLCRENIAPNMIIQMRLQDVYRYSQVSSHPWRPGWRIEMRDGRKHPTDTDLQEMRRCERFLLNCNTELGYDDARERDANRIDPFGRFLQKIARDLLRFDEIAIHTQMDNLDRVISFAALPAGNIRLCMPTGYQNNPAHFAVLVDDAGSVQKALTRDDMIWHVGNPITDPQWWGYGYSPAEMGHRIIMGFQNAIDLNISTFDKNGIPNGIIKLMGDAWSDKPLDALSRMWLNMKRGITKYWALPALGVPKDCDIEIMPLNDLKDTDVRYKDHMNMVMAIFCTLYGFPVRRLGYHASGAHRDSEPPPDGSTALVGEDDPGLAPLLINLEDVINPYIVWSRFPNLCLRFTAKTPKEDARNYEARSTAMTWRERRAEADLKPLTEEVSAEYREIAEIMEMCPADSNLASVFQTLATTMLQAKLGLGGEKTPASPGARTGEKKDPARSEAHGKLSGTRRDSKAEVAAAEKHKD